MTKLREKNMQLYHGKSTKIFESFENNKTHVRKIVQIAQKNKIQLYKMLIDTKGCF